MLVNALIAAMSFAAVGFYLTFLVALFKEYQPQVFRLLDAFATRLPRRQSS